MINLDLRTDLAKVPEDVSANAGGGCFYTTPCVVGMMMSPEERQSLADKGKNGDGVFYLYGIELDLPEDQYEDVLALQNLFDQGSTTELRRRVALLKEKYA